MGVAVGVGIDPLGETVVPLGAIAAAFRAFEGVGVGVTAGGAALDDIPLIIAEAAAGSTVLVKLSVGLVPLLPPLTTN